MDPRGGPSRRIRLVGARLTGRGRERRVPLGRITVSGKHVGRLLLRARTDARELGPADERLLAIGAAQLGVTMERARFRKDALETEVLRRADDLKTELLHAVSHELRTPLASILASAGSLLQRDVAWTERERDEFVGAIRDEALRLDRVVGNLLDLSRIENGSLVPHKAWHDVGALVEDVAGRLRPVTAGHPVDLDVPDDLPPVELDYVEIQQVLANLVENGEDLLDLDVVELDRRQVVRHVEVHRMSRGHRPQPPRDVLDEGSHVVPGLVRHQAPVLDARKVEEIADDAVETQRLVPDRPDEFVALAFGPGDVALQQAARRGEDRRERRPELVRDRVEELGLEVVGAAQHLGLQGVLAEPRALHRDAELRRTDREETLVGRPELARLAARAEQKPADVLARDRDAPEGHPPLAAASRQ